MRKQDIPFSGMLFTGLMITNDGPKVLEFNARFGDPETQALLPLLDEDLLPWLKACAHQELHTRPKDIRKKTLVSIHVTKASQGYPSHNLLLNEAISIDGDFFTQLKNSKEFLKIFFAGVNATEPGMNHLKTSGGRVLGITALAETKAAAKKKAYEAIKNISFKGAQMRNDIGD